MTTDFVTLPPNITAAQALEPDPRASGPRTSTPMSTSTWSTQSERLAGVVSLRDLVLAEPDAGRRGAHGGRRRDASRPTPDEEEVGRIMTKYDLLAIPVVDAERRILGIVTLDDALDAMLPDDWKQRLPRLFR